MSVVVNAYETRAMISVTDTTPSQRQTKVTPPEKLTGRVCRHRLSRCRLFAPSIRSLQDTSAHYCPAALSYAHLDQGFEFISKAQCSDSRFTPCETCVSALKASRTASRLPTYPTQRRR